MDDVVRVVVVGQVPPPEGGQTVMTRVLLSGAFRRLELLHVPVRFSKSLGEMGRFGLSKMLELVLVLYRLLRVRVRYHPEILYYVPAPPSLIPVIRDLVILNVARGLFPRTVFHFHAGGVSGFEARVPSILRPAFRRAYRKPDLAIQTSSGAPNDGPNLGAIRTVIVPNGIPDPQSYGSETTPRISERPSILYLGLVSEAKGIRTLLNACRMLSRDKVPFQLVVAGPFENPLLESSLRVEESSGDLAGRLKVLGPVEGPAKWSLYADADVLCFPSEHPSETFGLVIVEAFAVGVPAVASRRRGAPEIIEDGSTGLLFDPGNAVDLANQLRRLLDAPDLRRKLGRNAREVYLRDYTEEHFLNAMEGLLESVSTHTGANSK